MTDPEDERQ